MATKRPKRQTKKATAAGKAGKRTVCRKAARGAVWPARLEDLLTLGCLSAPSWPALGERIRAAGRGRKAGAVATGGLSMAEAVAGILGTWREWFARVGDTVNVEPADVLEALRFWNAYPGLYRLHVGRDREPVAGCALPQTADPWNGVIRLDLWHGIAERIIMAAAEGEGQDSASIAASGAWCREALLEHPELGEHGGWPDCLNVARKVEGPGVEAVRAASAVRDRLEVLMRARMEAVDYQPPRWFRGGNISDESLRKAAEAGKVRRVNRGLPGRRSVWHYCVDDARREWPDRFGADIGKTSGKDANF